MLKVMSNRCYNKYKNLNIECLTYDGDDEAWFGESTNGLFLQVHYNSSGLKIRSAERLYDFISHDAPDLISVNVSNFLSPNKQIEDNTTILDIIEHMNWTIDKEQIWDK